MGQLKSRVERLRSELRRKLDTATLTHADVRELGKRTAQLLFRALADDDHPLCQMLAELTHMIHEYRARAQPSATSLGTPASKARALARQARPSVPGSERIVMSDRQFFLPQPGISHAQIRRFWPLQLLLYIAGHSERQHELAERLEISKPQLKRALTEARGSSVGIWSLLQFGEHLHHALQWLDYPDPPMSVRVDGGFLIQGSTQVRLSQQQARFVRLLIERVGKWVEYAEFHKVGVLHPENIKNKLLKKLEKKDVVLLIDSRPGAYRLPEATS